MYNPVAAVLPAKRTPQRASTVVLSIATAIFYVGVILSWIGVINLVNELILAGVCILIAASILFLPGFILYRRNSGKPSFVGCVVQAAHPLQEQPYVLPNANQPLPVYAAQHQAQYFPSCPTQPPTGPPSISGPPLVSPLYQPSFQAAAVADAPPEYTDAVQLIKHEA